MNKFCPNCGANVGNGKFCASCGSALNGANSENKIFAGKFKMPDGAMKVLTNSRFLNKKLLIPAVVAVLILIVVVSFGKEIGTGALDGFNKEKAQMMVEKFYSAMQHGNYDSLEDLLTPQARNDSESIEEILGNIPGLSDWVDTARVINNAKYDIKYIGGSLNKIGSGEYVAEYEVIQTSNAGTLKAYLTETDSTDTSFIVQFTFIKVDGKWYISAIN